MALCYTIYMKQAGTYMYRYTDIRSGRRQTIYAGDLPELRVKEKQIAKDLDDNILTDSAAKNMMVNSLFQYYMATKEWADSTSGNYVKMWNNHVKDDLGNMKVVQLLPSHVKRALSGDYGRPPVEKDILTFEQQERLFSLICESNVYNVYVPMFTVLLQTGLRCGELIGLTWGDVDMANRELTVDHQLIYKDWGAGYSFRASKPKTKAGVRTIPFTENVYRAFTEQRKLNFMLGRRSTEEIDGHSDFIFLAKTGRPLMLSAVNNVIYNVVDKYNKEEAAKAKKEHRKADLLPRISAHNLRHTACTNMAKQGMNVKVLQYIMGHAHSDVTMDVYNHIANKQDIREEVERYARVAGN